MNKGNSKAQFNSTNFQQNDTSLQELHNNENDEKKYENMDLKLNILDSILTTACDCERQGKEITANLDKQSETLQKIDIEVENINDELNIASSTIDKLKGFFFWTPKKNKLKKELSKRNDNLVKQETNKTINKINSQTNKLSTKIKSFFYSKKQDDDFKNELFDETTNISNLMSDNQKQKINSDTLVQKNYNNKLDEVFKIIEQTRDMGQEINDTLTIHNEILDKTTIKSENADAKIKEVNKKLKNF